MTRRTYVYRDGNFIEKHLAPPLHAPNSKGVLVRDCYHNNPVVSPIDGKPISSRAELREHNMRHGVVDMGNDPSLTRGPERLRSDLTPDKVYEAAQRKGYWT